MADAYPKKILPHLEGKIGALRLMRFWSKVDVRGPDECWEWQASLHTSGYGRFKIASYQMVSANRMALISHRREEPEGMMALHTCDNRKCCNPHHLYFGTHDDNMRDKVDRQRCRTGNQSGQSNGAAKLTEEQVGVIVDRMKAGWNNKMIASDLPVGHAMVSKIRTGAMWRDVTQRLGWQAKPQFERTHHPEGEGARP